MGNDDFMACPRCQGRIRSAGWRRDEPAGELNWHSAECVTCGTGYPRRVRLSGLDLHHAGVLPRDLRATFKRTTEGTISARGRFGPLGDAARLRLLPLLISLGFDDAAPIEVSEATEIEGFTFTQ